MGYPLRILRAGMFLLLPLWLVSCVPSPTESISIETSPGSIVQVNVQNEYTIKGGESVEACLDSAVRPKACTSLHEHIVKLRNRTQLREVSVAFRLLPGVHVMSMHSVKRLDFVGTQAFVLMANSSTQSKPVVVFDYPSFLKNARRRKKGAGSATKCPFLDPTEVMGNSFLNFSTGGVVVFKNVVFSAHRKGYLTKTQRQRDRVSYILANRLDGLHFSGCEFPHLRYNHKAIGVGNPCRTASIFACEFNVSETWLDKWDKHDLVSTVTFYSNVDYKFSSGLPGAARRRPVENKSGVRIVIDRSVFNRTCGCNNANWAGRLRNREWLGGRRRNPARYASFGALIFVS